MQRRPVLAVVSYLNTRPLVEGLAQRCELIEAVPARCWDLVRSGQADLGLIPALGVGDDPELAVVPEVAIAAEGPVWSVVLVTRTPLDRVTSVAVDSSSRASVALLRILLSKRYGLHPRFKAMPPDWEAMLAEHEAALVIGDPALALATDPRFTERTDLDVIDLGTAWTSWTGLPFVFAVWAGRPERVTPEIVTELLAARDRGLARLPAIARAAARSAADELRYRRYFAEAVRYRLGPSELAGLKRYLELAGELGLLAGRRRAPAAVRLAGHTLPVTSTTDEAPVRQDSDGG